MQFRNATPDDLENILELENICFPPNEAASKASLYNRLKAFPQHFWLLEKEGQLIGFINGMVTNNETIADAMFKDAGLHDENAKWQCVFGLAVAPVFRKQGYAAMLINHMVNKARQENRAGITLTCKEQLVPYYQKLGFTDQGISASTHGGVVWHDMTIRF